MNRNLKILVMLGAAVLAFAATAPAASAWKFHKEDKTAKTKYLPDGKNKVAWTFEIGKVECQETGEDTTEFTEATEEAITVTSDECTQGEAQVKVVENGCSYHFVSGLVDFIGTMTITCPPNKKFEFQSPGCTITVPEQKGLSSVTFTNIANGGKNPEREVTAKLQVANLKYEEDNVAPGNTCTKTGVLHENGAINGPQLLTDENAKPEMKGFWVA